MNKILNFARPSRFLKPGRSLLLLMLFVFCTAAFATPTTPTSDFIDNGDGTVTHKLTGLVWMRCSMGQTWDKATASCTGTAATYTWVAAMALKSNFAGKSDWRLPNIAELQTIVERENYHPAINTTMFSNIQATWPNTMFLSSSLYRDSYVRYVDFSDGLAYMNPAYTTLYSSFLVRLVRAGQPLKSAGFTPNTDFTDNGNGTVIHKRTGLMWQRCAVGQTWTGAICLGTANTYNYQQSLSLTHNTYAGYSDWRIPTANELVSIMEYKDYLDRINYAIFPNSPKFFLSSSPVAWSMTDCINEVWLVSILYGDVDVGYVCSGGISFGSIKLVRGNWYAPALSDLDLSQAKCRYAAPIYSAMWQQMKTRTAPSCYAVVRYHTWTKTVRPENIAASQYFSNQIKFIANDKAFYDGQLKTIDDGMSLISDVLDPDLKRALTPTSYTRSINIFKKQGLIASIAAGKTPFNRATLSGRVIDKALKEKVIAAGASDGMCQMLFNDAATVDSCTTESSKIGECTAGIVTDGWGGVSGCVLHGVTSVGSAINSWMAVLNVESSRHRINEYLLINDYLNNYFAKGSLQVPNVDADLNKAIEAYAVKYNFSSNEDLFVILWDYDKSLVRAGIRNGISRVVTKSGENIKLTEKIRAMLK